MTDAKGSILWEGAYALGKMLDHSSWQKGERPLPRRVTPSDIDLAFNPTVIDNAGKIIFAELTRHFANWSNVSYGQRRMYESVTQHTPHCAVLCKHSVSPDEHRQIDTRTDVESFQIMLYDCGFVYCAPHFGNESWQGFVHAWFRDPLHCRRYLLGRHIGMKK